jgi:hypothetical protein
MSWNYRIFHEKRKIKKTIYHIYSLREAYYNKNGEVEGWTDPILSSTFEKVPNEAKGLISDLELMLKDAKKTQSKIIELDQSC